MKNCRVVLTNLCIISLPRVLLRLCRLQDHDLSTKKVLQLRKTLAQYFESNSFMLGRSGSELAEPVSFVIPSKSSRNQHESYQLAMWKVRDQVSFSYPICRTWCIIRECELSSSSRTSICAHVEFTTARDWLFKWARPEILSVPLDNLFAPERLFYSASQVLSARSKSFSRPVSEREWLKNSAKIWEMVKNSSIIAEYGRALQSSGMFRR